MLYDSRLNGVVEDIAAAIGYTATCTFVEWYGGRDVWVPISADEKHELAKVLGLGAMRRLCDLYGNQRVVVPTDFFRDLMKRDRIVAEMVRHGHGTKSIAATIGVTERSVQKTRRRLEENGILPTAVGVEA